MVQNFRRFFVIYNAEKPTISIYVISPKMSFKFSMSKKLACLAICVAYLALVCICKVQDGECLASDNTPSATKPESVPLKVQKPRFVCNPRCVGYYESYDVYEFLKDRCCTFIPCPQAVYNHERYEAFKKGVCALDEPEDSI